MIRAHSLLGVSFDAESFEDLLIAAERLGLNVFDIENRDRRHRVTRLAREWAIRDSRTSCWRPFLVVVKPAA